MDAVRLNVSIGPARNRYLMTGMHTIADVSCQRCGAVLGWKYVRSFFLFACEFFRDLMTIWSSSRPWSSRKSTRRGGSSWRTRLSRTTGRRKRGGGASWGVGSSVGFGKCVSGLTFM